jgi:hypothetical protein
VKEDPAVMRTFARHFEEGFRQLRREVADLSELLAHPPSSGGRLDQLRARVRTLHADLGAHYDRLDADGYLHEVVAQAPHFHQRMMRLHQQQQGLMRELQQLNSDLESPVSEAEDLSPRLHDLLNRIEEHETRKNLLAMDAFNVDPAAQD